MAEQARIAELVNDLGRRLEEALAEAEQQRAALAPLLEVCGHRLADAGGWSGVCLLPAGHLGPHGLPTWEPPPRRDQRIRVPEAWIDPLGPDSTWSPHRRACGVAVHMATEGAPGDVIRRCAGRSPPSTCAVGGSPGQALFHQAPSPRTMSWQDR